MRESELSHASDQIINGLGNVQPHEEVLVLTDSETFEIARSLVSVARIANSNVHLLVKPLSREHSNEPSEMVTTAIAAADVVFITTRHSLTHTRAVENGLEAGTRIVTLRSITERMMREGGITADLERVRKDTTLVHQLFAAGSTARIVSQNGTDITIGLHDHSPIAFAGPNGPDDEIVGFPPGEVAIAPDERDAQGTIVIDHSMDNIGLLDQPIELEFEDGFIKTIDGGGEAQKLSEIISRSDENSAHLAEFAIGTNPKALLTENVKEAKRKRGTVHFAIGDNASTLGGSLSSDLHLDGVLASPTVSVDGETVLQNGELRMNIIRELTEEKS